MFSCPMQNHHNLMLIKVEMGEIKSKTVKIQHDIANLDLLFSCFREVHISFRSEFPYEKSICILAPHCREQTSLHANRSLSVKPWTYYI